MPFQFNIEGPETRKQRELQQRLQELQIRGAQMQIEQQSPESRGRMIDESLSIMNDPNATIGQRAAAYQRVGELGGTRMVEGIGNVPNVFQDEQLDEILRRRTINTASRLTAVNRDIAALKAAGDVEGAASLEATRDMQFKNAKENFKKLPIRQAEDLADLKGIVELGQSASSYINSNPNLYGPFMGRAQAGMAAVGASPEYTQMSSMFSGVRNQILKARSGGAVTPQEADRFIEEIGSPTSGDFAQRMEFFSAQRRREYLDKLQAYREAGFEIPSSLMIGSRDGAMAGGGAQAQQAGGRQVIKYTRDAQGNLVPAR